MQVLPFRAHVTSSHHHHTSPCGTANQKNCLLVSPAELSPIRGRCSKCIPPEEHRSPILHIGRGDRRSGEWKHKKGPPRLPCPCSRNPGGPNSPFLPPRRPSIKMSPSRALRPRLSPRHSSPDPRTRALYGLVLCVFAA